MLETLANNAIAVAGFFDGLAGSAFVRHKVNLHARDNGTLILVALDS